jgi:K+-sensing histidine kinase KdpD
MLAPKNEPNGLSRGDMRMRFVRGAFPFVVTLAVVALVTLALWCSRSAGFGPHHPVFVYLLPIAVVAMLYGIVPAMLCAVVAAFAAMYFLYEPIYSFRVANRLEYGDLICFTMLALIGVKCTVELLRPTAKIPTAKARYGRP